MSEPSETDSPEQEDFSVQFSVKLVIVAEVPDMRSKKGRPKTSKTTKETKNKTFSLTINKCTSSYEKLLQAIVDKHNQKFKVSAQKPYLFKCVIGHGYVTLLMSLCTSMSLPFITY
jgi:hypothetical protein